MVLAQGRYWRLSLRKGADAVSIEMLRDALPDDLREVRDLGIEVPLDKWNRVVKQVRMDRKLLGGILLDFAKNTDHISAVMASDRLYSELQRVVLDATVSLVESSSLVLTAMDVGAD
jgi:hypothetical protein